MNDNNTVRITEHLKEYWEKKKGVNPYPSETDVDEEELAAIWESCFLIEVEEGGKKFKYEYLGNKIVEAYGADLEGLSVEDDPLYPESPDITTKLRETMQGCLPLEYEGAFISRDNADIKFHKILLPLGSGGKVNYILGGMRWREF